MLLDATAAKALASIIFIGTQGIDSFTPQLPLQIVDRGESWLVKGTPYTDNRIGAQFVASWVFISKTSAEVIGIGSDARMIVPEAQMKDFTKDMTPSQIKGLLGPRTRFEPGGYEFKKNMDMHYALYGGLINKPEDAVAYAHILIGYSSRLKETPASALRAKEDEGVWHIMTSDLAAKDIMTLSWETGKILSGDL